MLPPGRLGRYEILRTLGAGGMGTVYEAVLHGPAGFRKPVALKVLQKGGDGLIAEARLGGLLKHPNLVEVYALEQVGGVWVCAMELVRGGSLRDRLPLPPRAVVSVGQQVCAALAHAWDEIGLVHLDLKPDNLLLDGATVKVGDLGIARARGVRGGGVRGTPGYMAPELLAGGPVDPRTDLWAMGMVLAELACGQRDPDHPRAGWLRSVLDQCLATDPADRLAGWPALAEALAELDADGPTLAEQLGVSEVATSTRRSSSRSATFDLDERPATNLGAAPDAFVGRSPELGALVARLGGPGLTTLKGIGGIGKTRLSREAALRWHTGGLGETWFVDLTAARDALGVVAAVAEVLGVPLGGGSVDVLVEQVGYALAARGDCVLVLDNFEQVAGEGWVVGAWAVAATAARLLITSRVPLGVAGEVLIDLDALAERDAVRLLEVRGAARGRVVQGDPALPELARRLDGIPLALELAAARFGVLSPAQVLDRLDQRLRLLAGGSAGRHATLGAALDWSWELLDPVERLAFTRCSVFVGGFDPADADAVLDLPAGSFSLDVLQALLDHSLVRARSDGRLDLYESARVYARARLEDAAAVELRHATHYAQMGSLEASLRAADEGVSGRAARARLEAEAGNLEAAVERAVVAGAGSVAADALAAITQQIFRVGPPSRAVELCERVLALPLDPAPAASAAWQGSWSYYLAGRPVEALTWAERAAELAVVSEHPLRRSIALGTLAVLRRDSGALVGALAAIDEAIRLAEALDDVRTVGRNRSVRAQLFAAMGRADEHRAELERSLAEHEAAGDLRYRVVALVNLSALHADQGRPAEAMRCALEAEPLAEELGDRRFATVLASRLGMLHGDAGRFARSRAHHEEALASARAIGNRRSACYALVHLAQLDLVTGASARAVAHAHEAHELAKTLNNARFEALFLAELGRIGFLAGGDRALAHARLVEATAGLEGWSAADHALALAVREHAAEGPPDQAALEALDRALEVLARQSGGRDLVKALAHAARVWERAGRDPEPLLVRARQVVSQAGLVGPFCPPLELG